MQFEHLTFARTGKSVRIADPSTPYEMTLVWACCFYMQRHADVWAETNAKRQYNVNRFQRLNEAFLSAMLGSNTSARSSYLQRIGQGDVFLELAQDIERRAVPTPYLGAPRQLVWFSRRNASAYCEVTGYTRGMAQLEEFVHALNRSLMSFYNPDPVASFVKRTAPHMDKLHSRGTPASRYAADLLDFMAHWECQNDGAMVLTP